MINITNKELFKYRIEEISTHHSDRVLQVTEVDTFSHQRQEELREYQYLSTISVGIVHVHECKNMCG
jgi:hypothetical protein